MRSGVGVRGMGHQEGGWGVAGETKRNKRRKGWEKVEIKKDSKTGEDEEQEKNWKSARWERESTRKGVKG